MRVFSPFFKERDKGLTHHRLSDVETKNKGEAESMENYCILVMEDAPDISNILNRKKLKNSKVL